MKFEDYLKKQRQPDDREEWIEANVSSCINMLNDLSKKQELLEEKIDFIMENTKTGKIWETPKETRYETLRELFNN